MYAAEAIFRLFGLMFYFSANGYGHVEMVFFSSPNHTFSWASLAKRLTSTLCTILSLVTDNNPS